MCGRGGLLRSAEDAASAATVKAPDQVCTIMGGDALTLAAGSIGNSRAIPWRVVYRGDFFFFFFFFFVFWERGEEVVDEKADGGRGGGSL